MSVDSPFPSEEPLSLTREEVIGYLQDLGKKRPDLKVVTRDAQTFVLTFPNTPNQEITIRSTGAEWLVTHRTGGRDFPIGSPKTLAALEDALSRELPAATTTQQSVPLDARPATGAAVTSAVLETARGHDSVQVTESAHITEIHAPDTVPTHADQPALHLGDDELARDAFAQALALRLQQLRDVRRASQADQDASFMLHIHGPWGSGKTTLMNFMRDYLKRQTHRGSSSASMRGSISVLGRRGGACSMQRIAKARHAFGRLVSASGP